MTPVVDVARLRKELEFITAHRERWDQRTWLQRTVCGTVGCLAGNAVLNAGYVPMFHIEESDATGWVVNAESQQCSVREAARRLFGLTPEQSEKLFSPFNSLRGLWLIAEQLTDGEIQVPPELDAT